MEEERAKQRTTVEIYGEKYTVVGLEEASHIREVARFVNDRMREIKERNPYMDAKKIAVLTALNTANEYIKLKSETNPQDQEQEPRNDDD